MTDRDLLSMAKQASINAYVPYSRFSVGAALECADGSVFTGCNVENAAFGSTICAERTAFVKAVSEGCREFEKIAITACPVPEDGADEAFVEAWPCGICRQFMKEFCEDDFVIITGTGEETMRSMTMKEILPEGFRL